MSQMPEVNQDTYALIRSIGHMLRAPLSNILQLADLITFGTEGESSDTIQLDVTRIRGFAEIAIENTDKMLAVLIALSREHHTERLDLSTLFNKLQREFGVELSPVISPDLPILYANNADLDLIFRVLIKILINRHKNKIHLTAKHDKQQNLIDFSVFENAGDEVIQLLPLTECLDVEGHLSLDLLLLQGLTARNSGVFLSGRGTNTGCVTFRILLPVHVEE